MLNFVLQPMGINLIAPEEGDESNELKLVVTLGAALPFEETPGAGPILAPIAQITLGMDKEFSEKLANALIEGSEKLQPKSNLTVAKSLAGIQDAAEFTQKLRGQ